MPTIRLMTWNIEKLGRTKIQFEDILRAIGEVVAMMDVDVLIVQEINTTQDMHASVVAAILTDELARAHDNQAQPPVVQGTGPFRSWVLSPNTEFEFYGFFFRDTGVVAPVTATGPAPTPVTVRDLTTVQFTTQNGAAPVAGHFPLLEPDLARANQHHVAQWMGARRPCFALLDVVGAQAANRYLGVLNCHLKPHPVLAPGQINVLPAMSVLNGVATGAPLALNVDGAQQTVGQAMVAGDFNVHYPDGAYNPLTGAVAPRSNLGYTSSAGGATTHLYTPWEYRRARPRGGTRGAAVHAYDDLFLDPGFARAPNPAANARACLRTRVADTVDLVQRRVLRLTDSVSRYAELDMRGFTDGSNAYVQPAEDFRGQLLDHVWRRPISLYSAVVGARLISDHLPVVVDLQIP